jgi:superfamily II DNA/RNA helicase
MSNKKKQVSVEDIVKDVCDILDNIISDNTDYFEVYVEVLTQEQPKFMTFKELGIIEPILKALEAEGYTHPTPIQEQSIPILLNRKDLLGCAQTGTGKTAAFSIPIIQHIHNGKTDDKDRKSVV